MLLLLIAGKSEAAYTANGAQSTKIDAIAAGSTLDFVGTVTSITSVSTVEAISGTVTIQITRDNIDPRARTWNLGMSTDSVDVTPATPTATDYLPARLSNGTVFYDSRDRNWTLGTATDEVKICGDQGLPFRQDPTGQIYAVVSPESGTNIKKTVTFSNIATGVWVEVGSYTVSAGKSLKLYTAKATGLYAVEYKVSDGVVANDVYLATAPASPSDNAEDVRPVAKAAETIVRLYAKTNETTNSGTLSINGFEY